MFVYKSRVRAYSVPVLVGFNKVIAHNHRALQMGRPPSLYYCTMVGSGLGPVRDWYEY